MLEYGRGSLVKSRGIMNVGKAWGGELMEGMPLLACERWGVLEELGRSSELE